MDLSVKELKARLEAAKISTDGCVEKADLVKLFEHHTISSDHVRLFAVSDVHVENRANSEWIEGLSATAYKHDAIIVAGDVSDDFGTLENALAVLKTKFDMVFFTAGNHDLWLNRDDERRGDTDSLKKLKSILKRCEEMGVLVRPARIGTHGAPDRF